MKVRVISTVGILTVFLFWMGCSKSDVPECGDPTVKRLVVEIAMDFVRDQALTLMIQKELHTTPAMLGNPTYAKWNGLRDKDPSIKKVLEAVDAHIGDTTLTVESIRTTEREKEVGKCWCDADLKSSNGSTFPVQYSAQYTDDGEEVYVEVFGLE